LPVVIWPPVLLDWRTLQYWLKVLVTSTDGAL
jgi:hypothetical protein